MREVKKKQALKLQDGEEHEYLPLTFETMLKHLYYTNERSEIQNQINFNQREFLEKIQSKQSIDGLLKRDPRACERDINNIAKLMKSHDVDSSTALHAEGNYFCLNLKKPEMKNIITKVSNLTENQTPDVGDDSNSMQSKYKEDEVIYKSIDLKK